LNLNIQHFKHGDYPSNMDSFLSIVICTHNPRLTTLEKVLQSLKEQTLPTDKWELLLIDNASDFSELSQIRLNWHPNARYIREEKLGLTPARLRGIRESIGQVIVFVDDDNILDLHYLENTLTISKDFQCIGAWGGKVLPEFEAPPPSWSKPYLGLLAIRDFQADQWSNIQHWYESMPCGAGLCVRREVAKEYSNYVNRDPRRADMDRKGNLLTSCGDSDLALTACDLGLGTGLFTSLKVTHLIPAQRLAEDYLLRLVEGLAYSQIILKYLRGRELPPSSWKSLKIYSFYLRLRYGGRTSRFHNAAQRGRAFALSKIMNWRDSKA
jgi:glycosyltransferase involved in cell wall biosynthesis